MSRQPCRAFFPALTTFCWCLTLVCVAAPSTSRADQTADDRPPTSLEQTLSEHVCGRVQTTDPRDDVHERCVGLQFHALRAEFGYDLDQLSPPERGRVDSTCSRLRRPENVEPYLNCVTSFLVAAREQRRGASGMAPASLGDVAFGIPTVPTQSSAPPPAKGRFALVLVTLLLLAVGAAAAVWFFKFRKRAPIAQRVCQKCSEPLNTAGDLCSTCRHEAGIAAKQAIAERAAEERAELERRRTEREQAEERHRQLEQQVAEAERQEEVRRQDELRRQADFQRHQAQAASSPQPAAAPVAAVAAIGAEVDFEAPAEDDPYAILGVKRDASRQEIDRAYCLAASKYDETQVAHLGDAVQQHYRAKANAIEQAYRSLIGTAA